MGWGFRKRIRLAPGINLNVSRRGLGLSAGVRGATVSVGPAGVSRTLSLPGTGIYHTASLRAKRRRSKKSAPPPKRRAGFSGWLARVIG